MQSVSMSVSSPSLDEGGDLVTDKSQHHRQRGRRQQEYIPAHLHVLSSFSVRQFIVIAL